MDQETRIRVTHEWMREYIKHVDIGSACDAREFEMEDGRKKQKVSGRELISMKGSSPVIGLDCQSRDWKQRKGRSMPRSRCGIGD